MIYTTQRTGIITVHICKIQINPFYRLQSRQSQFAWRHDSVGSLHSLLLADVCVCCFTCFKNDCLPWAAELWHHFRSSIMTWQFFDNDWRFCFLRLLPRNAVGLFSNCHRLQHVIRVQKVTSYACCSQETSLCFLIKQCKNYVKFKRLERFLVFG